MKKVLLLVDNGPEFNAERYILKSGEYEAPTDRAEMEVALHNFFACPETPSARQKQKAGKTKAEKAGEHLCMRLLENPRLAYFAAPMSESYDLLTAAYAEIKGLGPSEAQCPECHKLLSIGR